MLVPGISSVFSVYYCETVADRCNYDDGTDYNGPIKHIEWRTWLISIGLALITLVLHLLGRLCIHLKDEFPVS